MMANESEMDLDTYLDSLQPEYVPKFPFSLFYSEGSKYFRMRLYKKALERLDEALNSEPSNFKALITRAKIHICLQQYEKAIEDATEALIIYPEYSEVFDLKGQAEYLMGDFEGAYLTYLSGRELRPDIEKLRLGQQLCKESMENSMKTGSDMKLDKHDIYLMSKAKDDKNRFAKSSRNRIPTYERFSNDKKILNQLLRDPNVKNVHDLCKESLDYIHHSERFWAMQKPLCSRKKTPVPKKRFKKTGTILKLMTSMKDRCQEYLRNRDIDNCIADGEKLSRMLENRTGASTEQNIKLQADVYHILGCAYEAKQDDALCLDFLKKQLEISQKSEFVYPQMRAFHYLGMYYSKKRDYKNACESFRGVLQALKPEAIKKYLEEHQKTREKDIKYENSEDISDIKAAEVWARDFVRNMTTLMPSSPDNDLLLELLDEGIRSLNVEHILTHNDSESVNNESYFTAESGNASIMSISSCEFDG